jgi:murein DD-endopeptidase MepM/ murein hydrolase activator NlpD
MFKRFLTKAKNHRRGSFAGSSILSIVVRPVLERDWIKTVLGVPLFAVAIATGNPQMTDNQAMDTWSVEQPIKTVMAYDLKVPDGTEAVTYFLPVSVLSGVSQGYHAGHPGIDFRSPLQSPVIAMENGKVESITEATLGYGRHVVLKHNNGMETLYAHLALIKVAEGDELKAGDLVGTIGTTGWSTGPHLHFEVRVNGEQVNPINYIGKSLEMAKLAAGH